MLGNVVCFLLSIVVGVTNPIRKGPANLNRLPNSLSPGSPNQQQNLDVPV